CLKRRSAPVARFDDQYSVITSTRLSELSGGWLLALLLQLFTQLLFLQLPVLHFLFLLLFIHFRVHGRALIYLGEFGQWDQKRNLGSSQIDGLDVEGLTLLEFADEIGRTIIVGHAGVADACEIRARRRFVAVDNDARAKLELQRCG